jgi:hypothetical protein
MVKTMLTALFLGGLSVGVAQDQAQCAVDGATAVNDLSDAAMFIWAASKRCGNPADSQVKCEIDITSAAQGATNMIATIVAAVADCGAITTESAECAAAVTELTGAAAGLAAASGGIVDACPNSLKIPSGLPDDGTAQQTNLGLCIIDAKGAMGSLFSASKYMSQAANCKQNGGCSDTAINIISALADMGSNLAESVNDCTSVKGDGNGNADCAANGLALVSALTEVASAGKAMKGVCTAGASRLYQNREIPTSSSSLTLALAAFLPIAAVLSFVVGRRTRSRPQQATERDGEPLILE